MTVAAAVAIEEASKQFKIIQKIRHIIFAFCVMMCLILFYTTIIRISLTVEHRIAF